MSSFDAKRISPDETGMKAAVRQLEEAIALIKPAQKVAYLKAKQVAPRLVELESNPLHFLQREKFDTWAAAKRLTNYWTERVRWFKEDRAFRPFTISDDTGAFTRSDIEMITSRMIVQLPPDSKGRTVLFFDRTRWQDPSREPDTPTRIRCFFYHALIAAKNPTSMKDEGLVVIGLMLGRHSGYASYTFDYPTNLVRLVRETLPIRVNEIHLVSLNKMVGSESFLEKTVSMTLKMLASFVGNVKVHHGKQQSELVQQLKDVGLVRKDLPEILGGGWTNEKFEVWRRKQMRHEINTYLTKEEKLERKRRINVLHSRQKRQRRKIEKEVMDEQINELKEQRARLEAEGRRLEELLQAAKTEVARLPPAPAGPQAAVAVETQDASSVLEVASGALLVPSSVVPTMRQYPVPHASLSAGLPGLAGGLLHSNARLMPQSVSNTTNFQVQQAALLDDALLQRLIAERQRVSVLQAQVQLQCQAFPGWATNRAVLPPLTLSNSTFPASPVWQSAYAPQQLSLEGLSAATCRHDGDDHNGSTAERHHSSSN